MLAVAGHDPSGAAGVQADIETIAAMGCGCATLITALTVQNTARFVAFAPQSATALREQAAVLLEDVTVGAVKIGMVGTVAIATELAQLVQRLGPLPVVLDPVLQSSTAGALVAPECEHRLLEILASQVTVLTPNQDEALTLTRAATVDGAAELLLQQGCTNVLVTGLASGAAEQLHVSRLYRHTGAPLEFRVPRLEGAWHGSGCTLSAALTAGLAQGHSVPRATRIAVNYTWECLGNARQHGRGQLHPQRSGRAVPAPRLRPGLYAIADADTLPAARLIECTEQVLRGGAVAVQYRNKQGAHPARHRVARALQRLCRHYGACFIINDDPVLARELGADGVHLGQHDADPVVVREWLGADALIGVSCYDNLQRACAAECAHADYVAFGSFFASLTRPDAVRPPLSLLHRAKQVLGVPIVAIGGVTASNARELIEGGADLVASVRDLYLHATPELRARAYSRLFAKACPATPSHG